MQSLDSQLQDLTLSHDPNQDLGDLEFVDRMDDVLDEELLEGEEEGDGNFYGESVHAEGVPRCERRLDAKKYKDPAFYASVLELLVVDLEVPAWGLIPSDHMQKVEMSIHKVSGSLTNAVFFVSGKPLLISTSPADHRPLQLPTVLLRVYGPSSGSLISRQSELHVLHTLSSTYGIGPAVFGTFANGRVEEYFRTRALHRTELRQSKISRWIARRMRELHRVDLDKMKCPERKAMSFLPSTSVEGRASSILSTSSGSSIYSFTSDSSTSTGSTTSLTTLHPSASPMLLPLRDSDGSIPRVHLSEGTAEPKKRSRSVEGSRRRGTKLGVWENIARWTREAKKVLKMVNGLKQDMEMAGLDEKHSDDPNPEVGLSTTPAAIPFSIALLAEVTSTPTLKTKELEVGSLSSITTTQPPSSTFESTSSIPGSPTSSFNEPREYKNPLTTPTDLIRLCDELELERFVQEVKKYRAFIKKWEKTQGRSKRVFAHNDTQYGNLLLRTPTENLDESEEEEGELVMEKGLRFPHEMIIVVDFEYSSPNCRAFDIGNHFIEWQADYHHPTLSHSLLAHGQYPSWEERRRFFRAYVGCDGGMDVDAPDDSDGMEDPRVLRLEEEVKVWGPSSHAMWAVWGIVQSMSDVESRINKWTTSTNFSTEDEVVVDFDYLSYSLCRIQLFRKALAELQIL